MYKIILTFLYAPPQPQQARGMVKLSRLEGRRTSQSDSSLSCSNLGDGRNGKRCPDQGCITYPFTGCVCTLHLIANGLRKQKKKFGPPLVSTSLPFKQHACTSIFHHNGEERWVGERETEEEEEQRW